MMAPGCSILTRVAAMLAAASTALCGRADMDEAWLQRAELPPDMRPLLGVILDRSSATSRILSVDEPYDPLRDYGAGLPPAARCEAAKAYWRRGPGPAPDCGRQTGLDIAPRSAAIGLQCEAARAPLAAFGLFIASRAAQWRTDATGGYWTAPQPTSPQAVECRADRGRHGATPGYWFAGDGSVSPWTDVAAREIAWDRPPFADSYIFYSGNFLNYLQSVHAPVERPMADLMSSRLAQALAATDELEVALIRVDEDGPEGGYIARAPVANRVAAADVLALSGAESSGSAPLAETLVETASWLQGGPIRFGTDGRADPAAFDPRAPDHYRSPFDHACRPVSLAFLTAGEASDDDLAALAANTLPGFVAGTGGCGPDCLAALGHWLASADLREDLPGIQSAPLSWIAPSPARPAIGGEVASVADPLAYANVIARAFQRDAALAADPQLSAAGLMPWNAGAGEPGVVFGLTAPVPRERWAGNLLRYALRAPASPLEPPLVVDRDGESAIDRASGLPLPDTRSLWSDAPDSNLLSGGANGRLPSAAARRIQTDIASARILDATNPLAPGNPRIDRAAVGLGPTDPESLDDALAWPASQQTIGDPGLSAPVIVDYPESGQVVAYTATHDGMLHAFDAGSGVELWAWMPQELLHRIPALMRGETTTRRSHGIDGPLVLHRHDPDGNGRITPASGEHLWLLFGLGRGGHRYYALDIAAPGDPRLLWSLALPDANVESRAEPVVTRLAIANSGQSAGEWVVLLAGGYDPRFDSSQAAGPGAGNAMHVVDAATGNFLWSAGGTGSALAIAGLASAAAAPRALDLDGDGHLDRSYLLDVTGSLWRIDFANGRGAGELATVNRLARLGTGAHRFHATPNVSIARVGNENRIAIAAGSGWIARPRDATIVDRLYVVFDREDASARQTLSEADLYDATDATDALPPEASGWFVRLDAHGPGEKVIGPTVTFDHVLRFQTYQPQANDEAAPCGPPHSVSRRYALDVRTALTHATAVESEDDEPEEIVASGLPVDMRFGFPGRWPDACDGCRPRPFGITGGETFDTGYAGDPVRTSWRKLVPLPVSP